MLFFFKPRPHPPKAKSCTGKSKMSKSIAMTKAKQLRARGVKMYAYQCHYCRFASGKSVWHLGHRR